MYEKRRSRIGHLRIILCICVKTNLCGKLFVGKCVPWRGRSFSYERFSTRTRFETESEDNMEIVHSILLPTVEAAWPTGQPPSSWDF